MSCPTHSGPVSPYDGPFLPSPNFCPYGVNFIFPPGCQCAEGNLFRVECGVTYSGGGFQDGVPGCWAACWVVQTNDKCNTGFGDVEQSGTAPCDTCPKPPANVGKPVSLTTGEMHFTHVDATVGELTFSRTYNSNRISPQTRYGVFGPGWNTGLEPRLRFGSATVIEARNGDGEPVVRWAGDAPTP